MQSKYFLLQFLDFQSCLRSQFIFLCKNSTAKLIPFKFLHYEDFIKFYFIRTVSNGFFYGVRQGANAIFFQMCHHITFVSVEDMGWLIQQSLPLPSCLPSYNIDVDSGRLKSYLLRKAVPQLHIGHAYHPADTPK